MEMCFSVTTNHRETCLRIANCIHLKHTSRSNQNPLPYFLLFLLLSSFTVVGHSCSYFFSSVKGLKGSFSSPNYPNPYPMSTHCRYMFVGNMDERIRIIFDFFELQIGVPAGCLYDYVDIFTIDGSDKELKGRYCGWDKPPELLSVYPRIEMLFVSNDVIPKLGFSGTFEFINETNGQYYSHSPVCKEQFIKGVGGQLMSPGFPNPHPSNISCTWVIKVAKEKQILLTFVEMDLGNSVRCKERSNTVSIYNGFANDMKKPELTVCGKKYFYNRGMREFVSKSYRVTVRFKASPEQDSKSRGFLLSWTAVKKPKYTMDAVGNYIMMEPCSGFHCLGGEYCIDTKGILCNPLPRYCIDKSLQCNDISNCGMSDTSDEDGCYMKILFIVGGILGPIITIAICVGVVCFAVRRWKIHRSNLQEQGLTMTLQKLEGSPSMKRKGTTTSETTNQIYTLRNGSYCNSSTRCSNEKGLSLRTGQTVMGRHAQLKSSPRLSAKYSYQLVVNSQAVTVNSNGKSSIV